MAQYGFLFDIIIMKHEHGLSTLALWIEKKEMGASAPVKWVPLSFSPHFLSVYDMLKLE